MKYLFQVALLSLAVALVVGVTTSTIVPQVFADPSFNAQDDKNNPTYPGSGAGKKDNEKAIDNTDANCFKHFLSDNGAPAQCY
jgi:hypothetical protein